LGNAKNERIEKVESVLTAKLLIIGILLTLAVFVVSFYCSAFVIPGYMSSWYADPTTNLNALYQMGFLMATLTILGQVVGKMKLDPRKYAILFSMIMVSNMFVGTHGYPWIQLAAAIRARMPGVTEYGPYIHWWVPPLTYTQDVPLGGLVVPWDVWAPALGILITGWLIYFLMMIGLISIFRRQFIDIEKLEFPNTTIISEPLLASQNLPERKSYVKRLAIGIILGLAFQGSFALNVVFPWFPSPTAIWFKWPWISWHPGTFDIGIAIPAIWSNAPGWNLPIYLDPIWWAVTFLAPIDLLLSMAVFQAIGGGLLPWIWIITGNSPKPAAFPGPGSSAGWRYFCEAGAAGNGAPGDFFSQLGAIFGLALFPLVLGGNWRYLRDSLKAVAKGPTQEEKEREGLPYRWAWILFIGGFIALLAWSYPAFGVLPQHGFWLMLYIVATILVTTRVRGLIMVQRPFDSWGGFPMHIRNLHPDFQGLPASIQARVELYPNANVASLYGIRNMYGSFLYLGTSNGLTAGNAMMEAYRFASIHAVRPRDMLKAVTIAGLLLTVVGAPFALWTWYTYGIKPPGLATESWSHGVTIWNAWDPSGLFGSSGDPLKVWWIGAVSGILGFIFAGFLVFMRARFLWWPLHPLGLYIGWSPISNKYGIGYTGLCVYFIKRLVFRVGGVRMYDEWGKPLAIGYILGYGTVTVLWGLISLTRF
jgi:hypothetical protein